MPIQRKLAVLDPTEIGPGLCHYLLNHRSIWKPVYCENMKELEAAQADLALVGQSFWMREEERLAQNKNWIFLDAKGTNAQLRHIQPYQPADLLLQEISELVIANGMQIPVVTAQCATQVVAVMSPHGYDLQTGFAIVYSLIRAQSKRVLYLNFQYYCGFFDTYKRDIGDLFYMLHRNGTLEPAVFTELAIPVGNLDIIPPVGVQMDLEDLTPDDLGTLICELQRLGIYDLVVFDLPVRPRFYRELYLHSNNIYSLQKEGEVYDQAQIRLLDDLEVGEEIPSHFHIVKMPQIAGTFGIDGSIYEELLFGEMAKFIREHVLGEASDEGLYGTDSKTGFRGDGCLQKYDR